MKLLSKRGAILFIFTLQTLIISQPIWAMTCTDLFENKKTTFVRSPIAWVRENLPALVSRVRPAYRGLNFDVRVISTAVKNNTSSPVVLKETAINEVRSLQDSMTKLGFRFRSYIQVLVEAHPNAVRRLDLDENGNLTWVDITGVSPWVGNARELIGLPGITGKHNFFMGRTKKMGFDDQPRFLLLTAVSKTDHSLYNRLVVAHELGHETENSNSHRSLIWREARADLLAYLVTNQTDLIYQEGLTLEMVRKDGTFYKEKRVKIRSIKDPYMRSIKDIQPHISAYHYNSEIISSALYQVAHRLGRDKLVKFIHWMDKIEGKNRIPMLEAKLEEVNSDFQPEPNVEYINYKSTPEMRSAIESQIHMVTALIIKWAGKHLSTTDLQVVNSILTDRGIYDGLQILDQKKDISITK